MLYVSLALFTVFLATRAGVRAVSSSMLGWIACGMAISLPSHLLVLWGVMVGAGWIVSLNLGAIIVKRVFRRVAV